MNRPDFKELLLDLMFEISQSWHEDEIPIEIRGTVREIKVKLGVNRIDSSDEVWKL